MAERPPWMADWPAAVDWQKASPGTALQQTPPRRLMTLSPNQKPRPTRELQNLSTNETDSQSTAPDLPVVNGTDQGEGSSQPSATFARDGDSVLLEVGTQKIPEASERISPGGVSKVSIADVMDTIMGSSDESENEMPADPALSAKPTEPHETLSPGVKPIPEAAGLQTPNSGTQSPESASTGDFKSGDVAQFLLQVCGDGATLEEAKPSEDMFHTLAVPTSTILAHPTPLQKQSANSSQNSEHDLRGTFDAAGNDNRIIDSPYEIGGAVLTADSQHRAEELNTNGVASRGAAARSAAAFEIGSTTPCAFGLLEVYVLEACNLPTAEFSRAFAVLQVEPSGAGIEADGAQPGPANGDTAGPKAVHRGGWQDGEVMMWGADSSGPEHGEWTAWSELRAGQAHKTEVAEGLGTQWGTGFRLKVPSREGGRLRVQVLHVGKTATEFVGEVVMDLQELTAVLTPNMAGPNTASAKEQGKGSARDLPALESHASSPGASPLASLAPGPAQSAPGGALGRLGGERDPVWEEMPAGEKHALNWHGHHPIRASWLPLRTAAGARVRSNDGKDSEVRLGMVWRAGVPDQLRERRGELWKQHVTEGGREVWEPRLFWLEPLEQVLRFAVGDKPVGRVSVRAARAAAVKHDVGKPHAFEVKTPSSKLLLAANDDDERDRWMKAIKDAGGVFYPPPTVPLFVRYRWMLICLFFLLLLVALGLTGYFLLDALPWNQPSEAEQTQWHQCPGSRCDSCDCFKRCMFARSLGGHAEVTLLHHSCAADCQCSLPPPVGACGDGLVRDVVVDWYGVPVSFPEQCDDGNSQSGDGCSSTCEIEEYMMLFKQETRVNRGVADGTRTLCGSNHTFPDCEHACLTDASCACAWFGGGVCHLYTDCAPTTPGFDNQEASYVEVEYPCGDTGSTPYDFDEEFVDIRVRLILFGSGRLDDSEREHFQDVMRINMQPCLPCSTTITGEVLTVLSDTPSDVRRSANGPVQFRSAARRENHQASGSNATEGNEERDVLFVDFKVMVEAVAAEAVLARMRQFIADGMLGFAGALRNPPLFPELRGLIVNPDDGTPTIHPRPAPPPEAGNLFRKRQFQCFPDRHPPFENHTVSGPVRDVCCGNISNVCSPVQRCYVSKMQNYDCVVARAPYPPTGAVAVPWDERADLYWNPPEDDGGFEVEAYYIEKVRFLHVEDAVNASTDEEPELLRFEMAVERTETTEPLFVVHDLINFSPYYLRVSAINRIGRGAHSEPTPPFTPNVKAPDPPTNGMASIGNGELWLTWEPSVYDGGRPIYSYLLEVDVGDGVWNVVPLSESLLTGVAPPTAQYEVTFDTPQAPLRRNDVQMQTSRHMLATTTALTTTTPTPRNCSTDCDPLSTTFHVLGDHLGNPLRNAQEYLFRLLAANTFSPSVPSNVLALTPTGHVPHAVRNLTSVCHEEPPQGSSYAPSTCTSGFSDSQRIAVSWAVPDYDGGAVILFYEVRISTDDGQTFMDVHQEQVAEGAEGPWSYMIENLQDDQAYKVQVMAHNLYGNGTTNEIGPVTPRLCPHLVECGLCVEPSYDIWGGCAPPECQPGETSKTRLVDCDLVGCRLEVFYDGQWGTVSSQDTVVFSTDIACYEVGLRPRPDPCGLSACGSRVAPAPTVGSDSQVIWLRGVNCENCGGSVPGACCGDACLTASIHDCYATPQCRPARVCCNAACGRCGSTA